MSRLNVVFALLACALFLSLACTAPPEEPVVVSEEVSAETALISEIGEWSIHDPDGDINLNLVAAAPPRLVDYALAEISQGNWSGFDSNDWEVDYCRVVPQETLFAGITGDDARSWYSNCDRAHRIRPVETAAYLTAAIRKEKHQILRNFSFSSYNNREAVQYIEEADLIRLVTGYPHSVFPGWSPQIERRLGYPKILPVLVRDPTVLLKVSDETQLQFFRDGQAGLFATAIRAYPRGIANLPREIVIANNCRLAALALQQMNVGDSIPDWCWAAWGSRPPHLQ